MKKHTVFTATIIVFGIMAFGIFGCKKSEPTTPVSNTPTPAVSSTQTIITTATTTATITQTATSTATADYSLLVAVPGGTYSQTNGTNTFNHTLSAFKIGKYEVTYELWYTVYLWALDNDYEFANQGREGNDGTIGAAPTAAKNEPVTNINWRDMIVWCNAYSEKMSLTPIYCTAADFSAPVKIAIDGAFGSSHNTTAGSSDNPYVNWSANGYRLPTEGEWQYAASYKNGTTWTPYNYASGATAAITDRDATVLVAWYSENSAGSTHDESGRTPNALGIYNMTGNVSERCWDWYGGYPTDPETDYRGPATGFERVIHGGEFQNAYDGLGIGERNSMYAYYEVYSMGFRLVTKN